MEERIGEAIAEPIPEKESAIPVRVPLYLTNQLPMIKVMIIIERPEP